VISYRIQSPGYLLRFQIDRYRGKMLIRYKTLDGDTFQEQYQTVDEAFPHFLQRVEELRADAQKRKNLKESWNEAKT